MYTKKAVHPVVGTALLLVVAVVSVVSFQSWFQSFQSDVFSDVDIKSSTTTEISVEGIFGDDLYINAGNNLTITAIEINGIDCSINGSYSGLEGINISSCLGLVNISTPIVLIKTNDRVITSIQYIKNFKIKVSLPLITDSRCYDSSNINTIGTWDGCNGMLIVDRTMLNTASSNGADFYITFSGQNYTFGDSSYNIFTGQITDMSSLFELSSFNSDINYWDVGNVTNMFQTFHDTSNFNQELGSWNVSSVTNMGSMFYNANLFNQSLESWDISSVTNMNNMFFNANTFNQPLNNWNISSVNGMSSMFRSANSFNQPINNWNISSVSNIQNMFRETNRFNQPLNSWDIGHISDIRFIFEDANAFNQPLDQWNVSSVTNMFAIFRDANSFDQNISLWDVDQVTACTAFDTSASSWQAGNKPNFTSCTP
jgi:hypothetical protein